MKRPPSFCRSNRENAWTTRQKRTRFSGIEHNLDELLDHTSNAEEKILAMNFAIWALGCELSAEANAAILHQGLLKTKDFRDYNLSSWLPEKEECLLEAREIELRNVNVCAIPYHGDKLVWALRDVSRDGFKGDTGNCKGIFYPELQLATIYSAHHHTTAGLVHGGSCLAPLTVFSLEPYFEIALTDGAYLYTRGQWPLERPVEPRLAAMYRIAQRRYWLVQQEPTARQIYQDSVTQKR